STICARRTSPAGMLCERAIDSSCARSSALTTSSFASLAIAEHSHVKGYPWEHVRHRNLLTDHYTNHNLTPTCCAEYEGRRSLVCNQGRLRSVQSMRWPYRR